ncbi:MAG: FKBP-type peptidyl-prolyl cis-trans isomerase [Aureispira sp.]
MNHLLSIFCLLVIIAQATAQTDTTKSKPVSPVKVMKETSYAYGYSFASDLTENENFEDKERSSSEVLKGLKDGLKPDSTKLAAIVDGLMKRIDNPDTTAAKTLAEAQQTAYNLGYNALGNLVSLLELENKDLHYASIKKGYLDFVKGRKPKLSVKQQRKRLAVFFEERQALAQKKADARREKQAAENLAQAKAFLAENGKKSMIKTTASGLQYQIIKKGTGPQASINSNVRVHYTGTFISGKVFDSSIERGEPASFDLAEVIEGWQEGIALMQAGARYRLFIPPSLAYGVAGPSVIPPNSLLIFEVELLEVSQKAETGTSSSKMSYAYGYTVGTALLELNFTADETNAAQFVQGFAKGFEANTATLQKVEEMLKTRMASNMPSTNKEAATEIAKGIGYTSSAGLVQQVQARSQEFDYATLAEGYTTALQQQEPMYNMEDMAKSLDDYVSAKIKTRQPQQRPTPVEKDNSVEAAKNREKGALFLAQNAKKEGIVSLPNGLQYEIIQEGTGLNPTISSTVTTHYTGQLLDGTVFDSSIERGQPASFPLKAVIKGWQEGIPLMKKGAKYRFFIPADLAYGDREIGGTIPPGATLIFEVELLEVK